MEDLADTKVDQTVGEKSSFSSTGKNQDEFYKTLKKRVNQYFKENNISKFGNSKMVIKTIFMVSLYLIPFAILASGLAGNLFVFFGMWVLMALGKSGIGLAVMHDANHGAYHKKLEVSKRVGYLLNMLGGYALNWKIQHNVLHHTYTNISGKDEDIDPPAKFLRFSPHAELRNIHKYQYIYAWALYSMMTILWATTKDFQQIVRYDKRNLLAGQNTTFNKEIVKIIFLKLGYYVVFIAAPILYSGYSWYAVALGFVSMHLFSGILLSAVFQSAHVIEETEFMEEEYAVDLRDKNNWAIHQLRTTANFAQYNKALTWYLGGLNHQVEHHLFPNICHVHYEKISKIVKEVATEYGLPYHEQETFAKAVGNHIKMLKLLGTTYVPASTK